MMKKNSNLPLIIGGVLVALWVITGLQKGELIPNRPEGPDLYPAFSQNNDKHQASVDAETFGAVTGSVAAILDYDAKLEKPRLETGIQIDDLRRWTRDYATGGVSFKVRYPALADEIKKYLDQHAGTSGGPLDNAKRSAWIKALRDISDNSYYASRRLQ